MAYGLKACSCHPLTNEIERDIHTFILFVANSAVGSSLSLVYLCVKQSDLLLILGGLRDPLPGGYFKQIN